MCLLRDLARTAPKGKAATASRNPQLSPLDAQIHVPQCEHSCYLVSRHATRSDHQEPQQTCTALAAAGKHWVRINKPKLLAERARAAARATHNHHIGAKHAPSVHCAIVSKCCSNLKATCRIIHAHCQAGKPAATPPRIAFACGGKPRTWHPRACLGPDPTCGPLCCRHGAGSSSSAARQSRRSAPPIGAAAAPAPCILQPGRALHPGMPWHALLRAPQRPHESCIMLPRYAQRLARQHNALGGRLPAAHRCWLAAPWGLGLES